MATNEGLQPIDTTIQVPTDPNVRIPDHVTAASAAADAIHQQFYPKDENQPPAPQKDAPPAEVPPVQAAPQPQAVAPEPVPAPRPGDEHVDAEEWRRRFLSMQGRYNAQVRTNAAMEEQMQQLGQELVRTQAMIQAPPRQDAAPQQQHNLITDEDRESYGDGLIDLTRRAAREAIAPELDALRAENQRLTSRVQSTGRRELFATLDQRMPNWRAINVAPQFKAWLRLPNVYTGQVRGSMLKAAVDGAEAPKVLQLFNDFLAEAQATGQMAPTAQIEPPAPPAPRTPAMPLETLAAPGRARPAPGDTQVPSEKPIYSRAQISKFYDDSRKGLYAGRLAEYQATEADMQMAQREGRIR